MLEHCSALQLKDITEGQTDPPVILDVREAWEFEICNITGSLHIPMNQVPASLSSLDRDKPLVVICHHGMRSLQVANYLVQSGFSNVTNLTGGIDAWARDVEPQMATY